MDIGYDRKSALGDQKLNQMADPWLIMGTLGPFGLGREGLMVRRGGNDIHRYSH